MAAKKKINKSEEIRKYVSKNLDASAKEVVAALKKKGVVVSAPTVATVKSKAGLSKKRKGVAVAASKKQAVSDSGSAMSVEILCAAKSLAVKAGSTKSAIEALRALEKIDSISV